jgi:hypothetical protein
MDAAVADVNTSSPARAESNLPPTLRGQLYLLTYDRTRRRLDPDDLPLLRFALRAAVLTDLYLSGHVADTSGAAFVCAPARPGDAILDAALDQVERGTPVLGQS